MEKGITQRQLAENILINAVSAFQKSMDAKGVKSSRHALYNSFLRNVIAGSDGDVEMAALRFLFHGRFVDMGVGNGKSLGTQSGKGAYIKSQGKVKRGEVRKPKKWYSPTMTGMIKDFSRLMGEHFGIEAIQAIESSLEKSQVNINI